MNIYIFIIIATLFYSCSEGNSTKKNNITVTILPLKYVTEQIVGEDFNITTLVPAGASPETFEPTPSDMKAATLSQFYINTGLLDFEVNLTKAIQTNSDTKIISLSKGIDLIKDTDHVHNHDESEGDKHRHNGIDPHIWTSPANLKIMAATIYETIKQAYPDSIKYNENYTQFISKLDSLDSKLKDIFAGRNITFIIYHPALTYLARDYNLTQISIEDDGKEPSAEHIRELINSARDQKMATIFYQQQFSRSTVDALSNELTVKAVSIDPLAYNIIDNILIISKLIAN